MRLSIALLTILTAAVAATEAQACRLTDWLFGRRATPYAVNYAPYGNAAGYAPVATTPYAAAYAPVPVTTTAPSTSVLRPAWNAAPVTTSGVYQAQRPGYYDNPSVYTGLPVATNTQNSYRVPLTTLRGTSPSNSYLGAANQYPTTYAPAYSSNYAAAQVSATSPGLPYQITTPTGSPATAIPATPVAPLYPVAQPRVGGLARFFGSLFGTNYRSSYYRAPVTYYRPVTSVDPVSGTTVTVQQPCSSYVQQLQRTPYSSLQAAQPSTQQPSSCQPGGAPSSYLPYGQASTYGQPSPYSVAPQNGIGQVGAVGSSDQFNIPIPSTAPGTGNGYVQPGYAQPGFAPGPVPLTGAPPASMPPSSAPSTGGDRAPVDQPRLENYPPAESSQSEPSQPSSEPPKSYWQLQDADDSTALIKPQSRTIVTPRDPISLSAGEFTGAIPIQAPDDYESPFSNRGRDGAVTPSSSETFEAPPLPARVYDPSDATSVSNRVSAPVRDAALVRRPVSRQPAPRQAVQPKRDTGWYTIEP